VSLKKRVMWRSQKENAIENKRCFVMHPQVSRLLFITSLSLHFQFNSTLNSSGHMHSLPCTLCGSLVNYPSLWMIVPLRPFVALLNTKFVPKINISNLSQIKTTLYFLSFDF